jgi:outer membrane protein assembly factor BamB
MRHLKRSLHSQQKRKSKTAIRLRTRFLYAGFIYCLVFSLIWSNAAAQEKNEWPCFHGLNRDNKSTETGLLNKWPEEGPELLWTASGLGDGYSSVSIAEGHIFTAGVIEKQTYVFAFDLNGKQVWKKLNGSAWETSRSWARSYAGSRSTPTYDNSTVYHLGESGRLSAFGYKTGKRIWTLDFL